MAAKIFRVYKRVTKRGIQFHVGGQANKAKTRDDDYFSRDSRPNGWKYAGMIVALSQEDAVTRLAKAGQNILQAATK